MENQTLKLFLIALKGFTTVSGYKYHYVVAKSMDEAYSKVKEFMDDNDIGNYVERELDSIEFLAEDKKYPNCGNMLFT